jgi:hypothetical protein
MKHLGYGLGCDWLAKLPALSVARFAGFGIFGVRDPRVTLAALAHPGLLSVAASRLVVAHCPD